MNAVLLAPHGDDESLFSAFLALEHRPDLIVCTRAEVQQDRGAPIPPKVREAETRAAWTHLAGGDQAYIQWPFSDNEARTDWQALENAIRALAGGYDHVIAPAPEPAGGHAHHNFVGNVAANAGFARTTLYLTYSSHGGRSRWGERVEIKHPDWIVAKLRALACYESQIREPSTRPWFLGPLAEYVA